MIQRRQKEHDLQHDIRVELSKLGFITLRVNVGVFLTQDGRFINNGAPRGASDLLAFSKDGRTIFIEVKTPTGRVSSKQKRFLDLMRLRGFSVGIARSIDDAVNICKKNDAK